KPRGRLRTRYFHVHGAQFGQRQANIQCCVTGDLVLLDREPNNPHDKNAIMVRRLNGQELGYVPAVDAVTLAPRIDAGEELTYEVNWINSPSGEFHSFGLKVRVSWHQAPVKKVLAD